MREIVLDTETTGFDPPKATASSRSARSSCSTTCPPAGPITSTSTPNAPCRARRSRCTASARHPGTPDAVPVGHPARQAGLCPDRPGLPGFHRRCAAGDPQRRLRHEIPERRAGPRWACPACPLPARTDTLMIARHKFPGSPASLDALCRRFGIDNSMREKHGALLDSEILAEVYLELIGGRQPDLVLARRRSRRRRRASAEAIAWRPRPRPEAAAARGSRKQRPPPMPPWSPSWAMRRSGEADRLRRQFGFSVRNLPAARLRRGAASSCRYSARKSTVSTFSGGKPPSRVTSADDPAHEGKQHAAGIRSAGTDASALPARPRSGRCRRIPAPAGTAYRRRLVLRRHLELGDHLVLVVHRPLARIKADRNLNVGLDFARRSGPSGPPRFRRTCRAYTAPAPASGFAAGSRRCGAVASLVLVGHLGISKSVWARS